MLHQSLGLGHKPNVIPPAEAVIRGEHRTVHVGWHPVAGFAGKWFAEQTGLGKMITDKISKYPDPTQHWAVLVGDYGHQLWMVRGKRPTLQCARSPPFAGRASGCDLYQRKGGHGGVAHLRGGKDGLQRRGTEAGR